MVGTDNSYQHWLPSSLPDVIGDSQASPCLRNLGFTQCQLPVSHPPPRSIVCTCTAAKQSRFEETSQKSVRKLLLLKVKVLLMAFGGQELPWQFLGSCCFLDTLFFLLSFTDEQTMYCVAL